MILLWVFFDFCHNILYWFTRTEKKCVNVIDDDIYNRIIEFKVKNEIISMNRDYSNIDKNVWSVKCVPE